MTENENLSTNKIYNIKRNLIKCISLELAMLSLVNTLNSHISEVAEDYRESSSAIEEPVTEVPSTKGEMCLLDTAKLSMNPAGEMRNFLNLNGMDYSDLLKFAETSPSYKENYRQLLTAFSNNPNRIISALKGEIIDTLYIGDSRTQGLLINGTVKEEQTVYGVGYGYDWFIGEGEFSPKKTNALEGALSGIESKMDKNKSYNIAIWLGVNDLNYVSASRYFTKFFELAENEWKNHEIFVVSVSPVHDSKSEYIKNSRITKFNEEMSSKISECTLPNIHFIDLGFTQSSIVNYDWAGLHYGHSDCVNIQNIIQTAIDTYTLSTEAEIIEFFEEVLVGMDRLMHMNRSLESRQKVLVNSQTNKIS